MRLPLSHYTNQIFEGDAQSMLQLLPTESIDCVVTSPPYWMLRDYGTLGQLGHEPTFEAYIERLCVIFDEVKRVLKKEGTCWVNLGDTYGGSSKGRSSKGVTKGPNSLLPDDLSYLPKVNHVRGRYSKCLLQIPSRFAIAMIERGWILRNELIWWKPNCKPESVKDRFTVDFEKLFFFVKSPRYYFDQQFEPLKDPGRLKRGLGKQTSSKKYQYGTNWAASINPKTVDASFKRTLQKGRNKRAVWSITTRPFAGNHFAVYPPALIETPIKAGCPVGGVVLDPFMGSGTTGVVAKHLQRNFIGIESNPAYVQLANDRLKEEQQMV
jgi:site-specific DNA-methyltransferase (cytosine-N4-specific)